MLWGISKWRGILIAVLVLSTFAAGYKVGANGVQQDWDADRQVQVMAQLTAIEQNQQTITKLELKHAQATADLEYLRTHPAGRVRLPQATCASVPIPASGITIPITSPERASDAAQEALGEAQSNMESDAIEWSRALNACQVVMDWAKSFPESGKK